MINSESYREELFQWIWKFLQFDCSRLRTECGKPLQVIDTGEWNHGSGPDFLGSHLQIDGRDWYGSVEIHKKPIEWIRHQHHSDKNYNSVVLHVVYKNTGTVPVKTADGHKPFVLELKPLIKKDLHRLLEAKEDQGIACSGNVSFISQRAFEKQIEAAHQEYLSYKIDELMEFYDASLPISEAWKNCFITGMYKTLGIPSNKKQMSELAGILLSEGQQADNYPVFSQQVHRIAFQSKNSIQWNHTGMRPASRPEKRVQQAAAMHFSISEIPFSAFLKAKLDENWNSILDNIEATVLPGKSRLSLIRQLVYFPAVYLLGDLLQSKRLKQSALEFWRSPSQYIPDAIKKPFTSAGFTVRSSTKKIGLAHQYKRYCKQKNCHRCEVFKKAIRS